MNKTYTVQYGSTGIEFELNFKNRKTLGIQVQPDCSVKVNAPIDSEIDKVLSAVQAKAAWIIKQKDYFTTVNIYDLDFGCVNGGVLDSFPLESHYLNVKRSSPNDEGPSVVRVIIVYGIGDVRKTTSIL